ncbi:MAG: YgiT-type zinc finger protein [Leptospiraceae bacterium]|nr:YgiT-type zinc finger protein [Leptospiraceae bacterium]
MRKLLSECIHCGIGKINIKKVEEIISYNNDNVLIEVEAEVCDYCAESYYEPETIRYFERIRKELKSKENK